MPRTLDVLMVALLLAVAAWTFHVKGQSEAALERTAILEKKIALEREAIDLLAADWSLLTSPQRLEKLQAHFGADLKLDAVSADRIGRISDVPLKSDLPPQAEPDMREALSAPDARTMTGSIGGARAAGKPGKAGGDGH